MSTNGGPTVGASIARIPRRTWNEEVLPTTVNADQLPRTGED